MAISAAMATESCGTIGEPCTLSDGTYHIALPDEPRAAPVMVFLHGYAGSGTSLMRNTGLIEAATARGYALIAPNGQAPSGEGARNWSVNGSVPTGRDDVAFLMAVLDDAATRFTLDSDRVLITGFSKGGSMVWDLACAVGNRFAGYAPIAGTFWSPAPKACAGGPLRLLHIHGFTDVTVPLEGRPVRQGRFVQDDVFTAMRLLRDTNRTADHKPDRFALGATMRCRAWDDGVPGSALELCLHNGGHSLPPGWVTTVLDWFEAEPEAPAEAG